ncbi:hypothetical protein GQX73_g2067 [Xylaria multiplex]|uniref:Heterokaryon incompatibility domain-containing protein n=1 Tax=Xylaria multiplex TaxID=323545 RepID=A0A7C8MQX8_9PEZI|nr:hypothetical protein GQX73_g2067 [Xylaria multiplex]
MDARSLRTRSGLFEADHRVHTTGPVHCETPHVPLNDSHPVGRPQGCGERVQQVLAGEAFQKEPVRALFPVPVTASLEAALRELRSHVRTQHGFLIWADALCINQGDSGERAAQVARMRDIYRTAWQVVIWLGPEQHRSDLAILALRYMSLQLQQKGEMSVFYRRAQVFGIHLPCWQWKHTHTALNTQKDALEAIYDFLARPYWRRLWIIQEVALGAANSPVLCGNSSTRLKDILNALQFMKEDRAALGQYIVMCARGQSKIAKRWDDVMRDTYNISEKL